MSPLRQVSGVPLTKGERAAYLLGALSFLGLAFWMRDIPWKSNPQEFGYLQVTCALLCLTFVANGLVRFRGTHDRLTLTLAAGFFATSGVLAASAWTFFHLEAHAAASPLRAPMMWWWNRLLLAAILLVALWVERNRPISNRPGREIVLLVVGVAGTAYLFASLYYRLPSWITLFPEHALPRPWHLVLAAIFALAAAGYRRRLGQQHARFDEAIFVSVLLFAGSHLASSQSESLVDAPFALAQTCEALGYAVALAGLLWDNVELFDRVRELAVHDPLTGLANYRTLMESLESELERSKRTARPFAILLLDLDGLKAINDRYGHLVGSRALRRVADVLKSNSRTIDLAARYGGDEFAVVLPETTPEAARSVALRIQERLGEEKELPQLSVSAGVAVYARHGKTIEELLRAADAELYQSKPRKRRTPRGAVPLRVRV